MPVRSLVRASGARRVRGERPNDGRSANPEAIRSIDGLTGRQGCRREAAGLIRLWPPQWQPELRLTPRPQPRLPLAALVIEIAVAQLRFGESGAHRRAVSLVFLPWFFFRPRL